jgi:hypothetical protein
MQTALLIEEVPIGTATVVASQSLGEAVFDSVGNTLLQNHLLDANQDKLAPASICTGCCGGCNGV